MPIHWADKLADKIMENREEKENFVFNSGMSISGMMHIGNLRGELIINSRVKKILEEKYGKEVSLKGTYYTQDRFKAKEGQLEHFDDPEEAKKYKGYRLIDVPDPYGCHDNWVEHFNSGNHPYLKRFGIESEPITTTEFYAMDETKKLVEFFLKKKGKVREILNSFRERNPFPEDWIPYEPLCIECNRIDKAKALDIDFDRGKVKYKCSSCGNEGWSDLEKGKLSWRLEWLALWEVLGVDFEPYGKDHATPGGSRDSCVKLAKEFDLNYPEGFSFNWVYWKSDGERKTMSSSSGRGLTASQYLDIAEPEALSFLYMSTKPMKEIEFNPKEIPKLHRWLDEAEEVYFGEKEVDEKKEKNLSRSYELAVENVPEEKPQRAPYSTCYMIGQVMPEKEFETRGIERLIDMGHLNKPLSDQDRRSVVKRIKRAKKWVRNYASEDKVYKLNQEIPADVEDKLTSEQKNAVIKLGEEIRQSDLENEDDIKDLIFSVKEETGLSTKDYFQAVYLSLLSKERGPRLSGFIQAVGQTEIANLLTSFDN